MAENEKELTEEEEDKLSKHAQVWSTVEAKTRMCVAAVCRVCSVLVGGSLGRSVTTHAM